ncbi:carbohydrate ABC transporter permease [Candidatus Rhodobacter oscarellae]|nr:sugar ABC transporter permease [Candidatus Rhodobacter lobularis]
MSRAYRLAPWLFLAPAAIYFFSLVIYPIFGSFWVSFHDWDGTTFQCSDGRTLQELAEDESCRRVPLMTWVGLENYERFFDKTPRDAGRIAEYWSGVFAGESPRWPRLSVETKVVLNNIKWLVLFPLAIPIGLAFALFLNQTSVWIRATKSMFFFPFVLSPAVIGFVFQYFYDPSGPLEGIYDLLGWDSGVIGDQTRATYGIIVAGWYPQIAYCMIIYLAGLTAIEPEQIEAARLDGARRWKLLRRIILPQLWPATFVALVVTTIGALRSFDLVQVMTIGGPGRGSSDVLARYMYQKTLFDQDYGYGATLAVILFLIMLVFIAVFIRQMVQQED